MTVLDLGLSCQLLKTPRQVPDLPELESEFKASLGNLARPSLSIKQ